MEKIKKVEVKLYKDYPIFKIFSVNSSKKISNFQIIGFLIMLLISLVVISWTVHSQVKDYTVKQEQFRVTVLDEKTYAIIYQENLTYYLSQVQIENQNIKVYTNKQRIINSNDISYEVISFENVEKISKDQK